MKILMPWKFDKHGNVVHLYERVRRRVPVLVKVAQLAFDVGLQA